MSIKWLVGGAGVVGACLAVYVGMGIHTIDNGEYVVVKSLSGTTKILDKPDWFVNYGTETYYPDYMTLDFGGDRTASADANIKPIPVKYAEGGSGWIQGNVQVALPTDNTSRMNLHEKFRGPDAFMKQLVVNATGEAMSFTAGLMESQEAYMTHRAQFRTAAKDQLTHGLYKTRMDKLTRTNAKGEEEVTYKAVPRMNEGVYLRQDKSPLARFNVKVTQFNIQNWGFENATMQRIAEKRDAENKVITSRARTETAEQEKKEAEAIAAKNRAIREGEAAAAAAVKIVNAERDKKLAIIDAEKQVETAKQLQERRKAELAAAKIEAEAITVTSKAQAAAKDRLIKSGGELSANQKTQIQINEVWAEAFAKKAVPTYNIGDTEQAGSSMNATQQAMQALSMKAMKDLVDPSVK